MWNELIGWWGVLLGLLSGAALGMGFHREDWLGGYGSRPRRLMRLGHISLVALGVLNLLFASSASAAALPSIWQAVAAWGLLVGLVSMPLCCLLMALTPSSRFLFVVPVTSLVVSIGLVTVGGTILEVAP